MTYIEKEPIIEFITKGLNNPDNSKAYGYDAVEILSEIEYTPTADVQEVRHGKWIGYPSITISKRRRRTIQSIIYKCSCCGKSNGRAKPLYCKNCGALMDGKEAEAEATEKWNKRINEEK